MDKEKQSSIGNCPHCTKIIFKDAVFNCEASFATRCPNCNKAVRVIVKHKMELTLIATQDELRPKKLGAGPGLTVLILVLHLSPFIHHLVDNAENILGVLT